MDRGRAAAALLALAACFTMSDAAPATNQTALDLYEGPPEGCYYNFQHYGEGDRIMTNEPCLNCTCHNRMLMCYLKVCPFTKAIGQDCTVEKRADQCCPIVTCPDVPVDLLTSTSTSSPSEYGGTGVGKVDNYGCTINGKYFPEGSKVPPTPNKPCEHCYCIRNMTTCVMQECTLHVDGCTPIYHKDVCCPIRYFCDHPEDEIPLLDDMTTTVRPTPGFLLTTTSTEEPTTQVAMKKECVDHDHLYSDGALIRSDKPCVHCYCMKGDIVCVVQECGAPMENEGKNCTSLPPREGHCCPDTYICDGDELSTERVTESMFDDFTTLEPPRRVNIEGSGYRVEPETTQKPEISFETEGSGDESTTIKSIESSEVYPTVLPVEGELDNKYFPDVEQHPKSTEASLLESSQDTTTEPDRGLNTIEYETMEPSSFDKTTQKQYNIEQSALDPTTISSETKTTNLPYEENTSAPDIIVPSISDTTTIRDESIVIGTEPYAESATHHTPLSDISTPSFDGETTNIPVDQNETEGSGQDSEEQYETTTQHLDMSKPDKTTDKSITSSVADVDAETTHHSTYRYESTTENLLSLDESTEKNIDKLTTLMHATESGQKDEITTSLSTISPFEMSTENKLEKVSTLSPESMQSTAFDMSSSTQTGLIDENDLSTEITAEKNHTLSLKESTEKEVEKLTTLLPDLIHPTESEISSTQSTQQEEKDITTQSTTIKNDILPLEESTEKTVERLTTLLPELIHSTESDYPQPSTHNDEFDIVSTTLSKDKQDLPETTTFNPVDNEIVKEVISPGRIPGEGDCLQNGITYSNESFVPSTHKCQTSCKCVSSIIKCDPIICMPQPENMGKCHRVYDSPESCCPTYVCDHSKDTTPPESHSQMSGTESSILPTTDCDGDDCEMHDVKSPDPIIVPVYDSIGNVQCSDRNCSLPPVDDEQHITPTSQDIVPPSKDCSGGKCDLPSILDEQTTTHNIPDIAPPRKDCSDGKCDLPPIDMSPPDCTDGQCTPSPINDDLTTPTNQGIEPPRKDLPPIDVSPLDCTDGKCISLPIDDEYHTTPNNQDIEPPEKDCSDGKCNSPPIDVTPPDCSDGKCTPSPINDDFTTAANQDIEPPHKDCTDGKCEGLPVDDHITTAEPETSPPQEDCSDGKCNLLPIDLSPTDCTDGKCTPSPTDDVHNTTPTNQNIEPPLKDLAPIDVSPPDCSDGKCTSSPIDDQHHTTPTIQDIEPPHTDLPSIDVSLPDCSDDKCTPSSVNDEHHTTPTNDDIEPPSKDCSGGKCDLPPVENQTTPASPDTIPTHEDCSDGKCDLSPIDVSPPDCSDGNCTPLPSDDEYTTPTNHDIERPQEACSDGICDLPTYVSSPDCSDGKCTPSPINDDIITSTNQDIEPPRKDLPSKDLSSPDCTNGECTTSPIDDEYHTTPNTQDIEPPQENCSDGKCDLPPIDVSSSDCSDGKCTSAPIDDDITTPSNKDFEPPRKDCSDGKCDVPPIDDHITLAEPETSPPQEDCSDGKCNLLPIDVSSTDCTDGKCTPSPTDDEHHTTPINQDIEPPRKVLPPVDLSSPDCSDGKCTPSPINEDFTTQTNQDVPVEDLTTPFDLDTFQQQEDCSDGKCTPTPIDEEPQTTPTNQDIEPPPKDCSGGKCDLPSVDDHTTPAGPDTLLPHEDCSDGKCNLSPIEVSPPDCSDGKCTLSPIDDESQTIEPPLKDCSGGKCDSPPIYLSPPMDDEHHTTPTNQDIEPPRKDIIAVDVPSPDCSDGKCSPSQTSDEYHTTPTNQDIEPLQQDCSDGKCDLPPIDVSPDCSDGKCTPSPINDDFTTNQDIEPPSKDLSSIDVSPPDCTDGKCTPSPTDAEHYTTPTYQDVEPPRKGLPASDITPLDCSDENCTPSPIEDDLTNAIIKDTEPPRKDCSDGKCDLPPVEDYTTPGGLDTFPPQEACSDGKCDLPPINISPPDCSDGKCTPSPIDDEHNTTPTNQDIKPPLKDSPPIDVSPSDCSDGKCIVIDDQQYTTPTNQDIEPPRKGCSSGKCDLPPVADQTTPGSLDIISSDISSPDCSDGKCTHSLIDDEHHTTPTNKDIEPPPKDCSSGKCDLLPVAEQTTPDSLDIIPPQEDCSDGKCDLLPIDISAPDCSDIKCTPSPIDDEHHTTPTDKDIEPPRKDCKGDQCDLPSVDILPTECIDGNCGVPTMQPDEIPSIVPSEIPKETCVGDNCASDNEVCTDDNCRRTEISHDEVPISCKGLECLPSTETVTTSQDTQQTVEEKIQVSTEVIDHRLQDITTMAENAFTSAMSQTEKPLKSSDLPETEKEMFTTNLIEEPTTQSMETVTKYSQPEVSTYHENDAATETTTPSKELNLVPVTETSTDMVIPVKLPDETSADEIYVSTILPIDKEQVTESHKSTLPSFDSDIHSSDLSTPKDFYETELPSIFAVTTDKPFENVTGQQFNTETPDMMTTKILDISEKPSKDKEVYPTESTHIITSSPEVIQTDSPLSQFTFEQDVSTTPAPSHDGSQTIEFSTKPPIQTEKITEPSTSSFSEATTSPTLDYTKQPDIINTEQADIIEVPIDTSSLSTESVHESVYDKTTEHSIDLSVTTPYLVELEEHPHKTDDISSPVPEEPTTNYNDLLNKESAVTVSSPDGISITESSTELTELETLKPHDKTTVSEITVTTELEMPITTESVSYQEETSDDSDNRIGSNTSSTAQPFDEQYTTTQATMKPVYKEETTENNMKATSLPTISTSTSKLENDITTQSPNLDNKFGEEKPSVTTSASPTDMSKPFDELLPTDDTIPTDEGQFPPSGGYGQEPDYSDEDQAFGPGTCRYGGKVYVSAQQIPRDDPCDFCFCFRSDIICLQQSCPPPIHGCHEEPIQGFCCPRYECPVSMATALNLTTTTTTTTTTLPPHFLPHAYKGAAQRKGCQIKGHTYKVGEVVRASSGPCLQCTCGGDGQMKCDPKVCTPEPMLRQMIAAAVSAKRRR